MTFGDIYREVRNRIGADQERYYFNDVVDAINDAISDLRIEYIRRGLGNEFVHTQKVEETVEDEQYPFLEAADLDYPLLRALPIDRTVRQSVVFKSGLTLENEPQSFSKGELVVKGDELYEAVNDISNLNTYDLTFSLHEEVRTYFPGNGLYYKEGDLVRSEEGYYRTTQDYYNVAPVGIEDAGAFEKLYWQRVGSGYVEGRYVPFERLHTLRLELVNSFPFSIVEDKVYVRFKHRPFTISYIPEWERISDLQAKVNLPDAMLSDIQIHVLQSLIGEDATT